MLNQKQTRHKLSLLVIASVMILSIITVINLQSASTSQPPNKDMNNDGVFDADDVYKAYDGDGNDEIYTTWEGKILEKDEYTKRMLYCGEIVAQTTITPSVPCATWVLTQEGELEIASFAVKEALYGDDHE